MTKKEEKRKKEEKGRKEEGLMQKVLHLRYSKPSSKQNYGCASDSHDMFL